MDESDGLFDEFAVFITLCMSLFSGTFNHFLCFSVQGHLEIPSPLLTGVRGARGGWADVKRIVEAQ